MAVYTYVAQDLLSRVILNELPLHGVTFDRQLNKPGNFNASANLDNDRLSNNDLMAATVPGKTAVYVYRGDNIVWGGILWSRTYQSQGKSVQITGQTWESYAYRRIFNPLTGFQVTLTQPQCNLIQTLWTDLQWSDPRANIQVYGAQRFPVGDVTRSITYNPYDFKTYGVYIDDICDNFNDSPEFTIENYEDANGIPSRQLIFGYPRLGAVAGFSNLIIDYPGNILNYYWTENAADGTNRAFATGDGDGSAVVWGSAEDTNNLSSGWPILEDTVSHSGVTVQATINNHAAADLAAKPMPKVTHTFELKADVSPIFGSYGLGDDAVVQIQDSRFPDGMNTVVRTVGWSVTPSESDNTEAVTLTLQEDATAGVSGG